MLYQNCTAVLPYHLCAFVLPSWILAMLSDTCINKNCRRGWKLALVLWDFCSEKHWNCFSGSNSANACCLEKSWCSHFCEFIRFNLCSQGCFYLSTRFGFTLHICYSFMESAYDSFQRDCQLVSDSSAGAYCFFVKIVIFSKEMKGCQ